MGVRSYVYNSWVGGQATDKKVGQANAFANSQGLDFRKSPSQMSVLPGTRRADNGVVIDLLQNEIMTASGRTYSIGSGGNVYTCTSAGAWSRFGSIGTNGTFGITYRADQDAIYIAGTDSVSSITTVASTPTLNVDYYNQSQSTFAPANTTINVNPNQSGNILTTSILTSYVEGDSSEERFFQSDIQPLVRIGVNILTKGTGDWTMVIHDGFNNQLGTSTVTNANLVSGEVNYFTFTPIPLNVGSTTNSNAQTYHFHLTSTVADGTVSSSATGDLSTCDMELWANRMNNTKNGKHPMVNFQQFVCIGNGRYLSIWEPLGDPTPDNSEWQRQKLTFPPGYEVLGLAVFNEYLVIATELVSTDTNTPQSGILFYWDGLSDTYNYFTQIPEGSPEALNEYENVLYYVAGGNWYAITSVAATPAKIRRLPGSENIYTSSNVQTEVYPYAATVRYGIHLLAWPSTTMNTDIPYGIYGWGQTDASQPTSFGYSYILSTGSQYKTGGNNLTIGMVQNFGNILHISWRDDSSGATTYGVDVIDAQSTPAPYVTWESLIEDAKFTTKQKLASYVEAKWLEVQDGVSIVLKYSIDRGDWVYSSGATSNAAGGFSNANLYQPDNTPGYGRFDIGDSDTEERHYELQIGVDIYCDSTVTEPPIIVGVSAPFNDLNDEMLI